MTFIILHSRAETPMILHFQNLDLTLVQSKISVLLP